MSKCNINKRLNLSTLPTHLISRPNPRTRMNGWGWLLGCRFELNGVLTPWRAGCSRDSSTLAGCRRWLEWDWTNKCRSENEAVPATAAGGILLLLVRSEGLYGLANVLARFGGRLPQGEEDFLELFPDFLLLVRYFAVEPQLPDHLHELVVPAQPDCVGNALLLNYLQTISVHRMFLRAVSPPSRRLCSRYASFSWWSHQSSRSRSSNSSKALMKSCLYSYFWGKVICSLPIYCLKCSRVLTRSNLTVRKISWLWGNPNSAPPPFNWSLTYYKYN